MTATPAPRPSSSPWAGYRPEERLLVECVRRSLGPEDVIAVRRLVAHPLDWPYLPRIATRHQVLPLLQRALVESEAAGVMLPASAVAPIREALEPRIARNGRLAVELARLLRLADEAGSAGMPRPTPRPLSP
jgi:hypothetical protein